MDMPRFLIWSFRYPDALKRLIERIAEIKITLTEWLITEIGIDIIDYGDDWEWRIGFSYLWKNGEPS